MPLPLYRAVAIIVPPKKSRTKDVAGVLSHDQPQKWTMLTVLGEECNFHAMTTITTHEAKTHLSRYLGEVEKGREFIIARGKSAVAMLVPVKKPRLQRRPQVGDIKGEPFEFPALAFAPLSAKELKEWGL